MSIQTDPCYYDGFPRLTPEQKESQERRLRPYMPDTPEYRARKAEEAAGKAQRR